VTAVVAGNEPRAEANLESGEVDIGAADVESGEVDVEAGWVALRTLYKNIYLQ